MIDSEGPGRVAKTDRVLRDLLSPTTSEVLRPLGRTHKWRAFEK
jgi:hypothetical protein